jgi:hypothetical protein
MHSNSPTYAPHIQEVQRNFFMLWGEPIFGGDQVLRTGLWFLPTWTLTGHKKKL